MENLYTAEALSTGAGRNGHVRSTDGRIDVDLAIPKAMGGSGDGTNPEQLFAAGYAACFHSALQLVARMQKIDVHDSSVDRAGGHRPERRGRLRARRRARGRAAGARPRPWPQELREAAHQVCPYSNATRGNIDVTISVVED